MCHLHFHGSGPISGKAREACWSGELGIKTFDSIASLFTNAYIPELPSGRPRLAPRAFVSDIDKLDMALVRDM